MAERDAEIAAKKANFLSYYLKAKSGWMFSKVVHHPGTKAYDYAIVARALIRDAVPKEWAAAMRTFPNI